MFAGTKMGTACACDGLTQHRASDMYGVWGTNLADSGTNNVSWITAVRVNMAEYHPPLPLCTLCTSSTGVKQPIELRNFSWPGLFAK
jgi:hypothetical protein